jgi:hypothetical protein
MDIKNLTPSQMMDLAKDSNTTSDILEILSKHKDMFIRIEVARNPNTSPDTLLSLGLDYDDYGWVSCWALQNPNIKESDREYIYLNNPYYASKKTNTPKETLTFLASNNDIAIRSRVARNPNTQPETLTLLAEDKSWVVRWGVAENPNTTPETLTLLAEDKSRVVRWWVAENPNTPQYVKDYINAKHFMENND